MILLTSTSDVLPFSATLWLLPVSALVQQAVAGLLGCALLADGAAHGRQAQPRRAQGNVPE